MGRKGFRCNRNFLFRLHFNYTPLETLSYQRFACNRNFISITFPITKGVNSLDFWKWYEQNKDKLFWQKYRMTQGLDPDGGSIIQEKLHFKKMKKQREKAMNADNPHDAIMKSPIYDRQYLLEKWWDKLSRNEKEKYLIYTWGNKIDGTMYGFDWWTPYFKELGYITNCGEPKPIEPIVLYRGSEPFFRKGMSWTDDIEMAEGFAESWSFISNKYVYRMVVYPEQILGIVRGNAVDIYGRPQRNGLEYILEYETLKTEDIYEIKDLKWYEHLKITDKE